MAMMFGRFDIQSELSRSETASIFKAMDVKSNQVVALKTQSLEPLGDRADGFVATLIAEGESARELTGQNIVSLYGAGEIDGQFCAAMEYIQGNSIATMVARKEGFSIWDLLDITRQVCAGLEHASAKGVAHCSLEPAKIMVQWDGMVKILGYGISNMSLIEAEAGKGLGRLMPYCSPEQIRGEAIDLRSNLFTLGAILYEMAVGRLAFDATDPVALVGQIENEMPASPAAVNSKIQPAVSALIMKALAKDPAERYQTARELVNDLEECKETGKPAAGDAKRATVAPNVAVSREDRVAAASKMFAGAPAMPAASSVAPRAIEPMLVAPPSMPPQVNALEVEMKAAAAAATGGARFGDFEVGAPKSQAASSPVLSAGVAAPEFEKPAPRIAVDPMMAEPVSGSSGGRFSDMAEMPPLKEPVFEEPTAEPMEPLRPTVQIYPRIEEKPKVAAREVAQKTFNQIATIPPRLMLFSILGAVGLILVIAIAVFYHVRSEDDGSTAAPRPTKGASQQTAATQAPPRIDKPAPLAAPVADSQLKLKVRPVEKRSSSGKSHAPAPEPVAVVIAGEALIDSSPQGAQFQVDGKSDPSWVTPISLTDLSPGKHIISVSKSGYSSDIRSVDVVAGGKASLMVRLAPVNALMVVNSTPAGAEVVIDGKPTGRSTPAQFAVEKGSHTVLLRKQGYLEEMTTAELGPAQNFQYAPVLRALGNANDIRTVGKFNKLFGHGGDSAAGMGSISIHTQPKGAQVAINQRLLDKNSPVDIMLGPGNYVVDMTLTGFKPVHKVVTVDKGGKVAVDEILERQ